MCYINSLLISILNTINHATIIKSHIQTCSTYNNDTVHIIDNLILMDIIITDTNNTFI